VLFFMQNIHMNAKFVYMSFIHRDIEPLVLTYSRQFRALAVVGPRQSGKSTVVCQVFAGKPYVSLENSDECLLAETDPWAFLARFTHGAVIDEAQRAPLLFSYLQQVLDETSEDGLFVLTGSNNFLLQENISQTLAGRIGYVDLYPLCYYEICHFGRTAWDTGELIFRGCYPELYQKNREPGIWYPSYIRTYVERDVKLIRNIENTLLFNRFLKLCAGRIAQQLNISTLALETGIDMRTANAWLSVLQSSYIVYLLPPHHKNFNKRLVKTPKLYFTDTGLACALLGIRQQTEMEVSHFRGALFENYILMECLKRHSNAGSQAGFYYWRDSNGLEVDLLIDKGGSLYPIEIKMAQTYTEELMKPLARWMHLSGTTIGSLYYDGRQQFLKSNGIEVVNWREAGFAL